MMGIALLGSFLAIAGCGGDSGGGVNFVPPKPPPAKTSPGSGLFAIDCHRNRAYVPLGSLDGNGDGQVALIDIGVDPDVKDPRVKTIALSHPDIPTGTTLDSDHSLILVVGGGFVDVIDENTNTLVAGSPFAIPNSGNVGDTGQILYNPTTKLAILAVASPTSGFLTFDPISHAFGTVIPANYAESFALNSVTNVLIDGSDDSGAGAMDAVDVTGARACTLTDSNIGSDQDGASTDSDTNITVVSNEDGTASVLNLNGSNFTPASGTPCDLNEGGTPPNSVLVTGLPSETAGSAVNGLTHQAFLIEDSSDGVSLIQLPTAPVSQLTAGDLGTPSISTIPGDPSDDSWETKGDPYAVAVGECKNTGYAVDSSFQYLVQIDLATLQNNPSAISTQLPEGHCAGTTTTSFLCDNGNGVTFFPLPGVM